MLDVDLERAADRTSEPLVAFRTWTLAGSRDATDVRLLPIADTARPWPPRAPMRAECARRRHDRVPAPACSCGIHASDDPDELRHARDPAVLGTVALWGRVAVHAHGFRAEYGYPQRLALVCQLCLWRRGAERSIACDAVIRHRGGRMVPVCVEHLALCDRSSYPIPVVLDARAVERSVLDAYAVDVLRFASR